MSLPADSSRVKVGNLSCGTSNPYNDIPPLVTAYTLATAGEALVAEIPLQRMGKPEDIAGTALFLASPAGAWVNG